MSLFKFERGRVTFFDKEKNFGFLVVLDDEGNPTGKQLCFETNGTDPQRLTIVNGQVEFAGPTPSDDDKIVPDPKLGDVLVFHRSYDGADRQKAAPWASDKTYDSRVEDLRAPHYRLIRETKLGFGGPGDSTEILWESQGTTELSAEYPLRAVDGQIDDPLARQTNFATGSTTHFYFKQWVPDSEGEGRWQECEDPREKPAEVLALMATANS